VLVRTLHGEGRLVGAWVLVVHCPAAGTLNPLAVDVVFERSTRASDAVIKGFAAVRAHAGSTVGAARERAAKVGAD